MKIYVGNMSFSTTEATLRAAFEAFGAVGSVDVVVDRETNRPKGFGFVVMPNEEEAKAAIEGMNESELDRRRLRVNEARSANDSTAGWRRSFGNRGPRRYDD